jgi:hypothetical protein
MTSRWAPRAPVWLAILTCLILLPVEPTRAQVGTTLSVEPPASFLVPGESTTLALTIGDAHEAYGFEVLILFDPGVLQVLDQDSEAPGIQVAPGDFFGESGGFVAANRADNETGEIRYGFTSLAPAPPKQGDGTLLLFRFQAVAPGQSQVAIESAILASTDGESLPFTAEGGQITVVGEGEDTPTPATPSPPPNATAGGAGPTAPQPSLTPLETPGEALPTSTPPPMTSTPTPQDTGPTPSDTLATEPTATAIEQTTASPTPTPTRTRLAAPTAVRSARPSDEQPQAETRGWWLWAVVFMGLLAAGVTTGYYLTRRSQQNRE